MHIIKIKKYNRGILINENRQTKKANKTTSLCQQPKREISDLGNINEEENHN